VFALQSLPQPGEETMDDSSLNPQQQDKVRELVETLRPRLEQLLHETAAQLAANLDTPFGANEFRLRDLLQRAGADLLTAALAQKKTATTDPR
jgi:hypothetical protein